MVTGRSILKDHLSTDFGFLQVVVVTPPVASAGFQLPKCSSCEFRGCEKAIHSTFWAVPAVPAMVGPPELGLRLAKAMDGRMFWGLVGVLYQHDLWSAHLCAGTSNS